MSWARLDDAFPDHPKVERLSDAAFRVHVRAICFAARLTTNGKVPKTTAARWAKPRVVQELVTGGLLEDAGEDWAIHDYLDYNPSREQIQAERANNAERQQKWRDRNAVTNGVTNTVPSPPIPSGDPNPTDSVPTTKPPKRQTDVDEPFRQRMAEKYAGIATAEEVNERIDDALSHSSRRKWTDIQRYVQNWLREDREFVRRLQSTTRGGAANGDAGAGAWGSRPRVVAGNSAGPGAARGEFPVAKRWPPDAAANG